MTANNQIHILTVDDNPVNLFLITTILKKIRPEAIVHQAKSGTEAIESLKSYNPDLIFMDIKLPDMTGYDVIQRFRNSEQEERTPIIVVSANNSKEGDYSKYAELIDGYLEKPIKYDALKSFLDNYIE